MPVLQVTGPRGPFDDIHRYPFEKRGRADEEGVLKYLDGNPVKPLIKN